MSSHNILIVDDAAETRLFLKSLIKSLGYVSFEAKNGQDALNFLRDNKIDLILLDILMPNMDGYQLLEKINAFRSKNSFKVAYLTGIRGELDQTKLDILKPDDIIHKTVDIHVLKTKIKKLMNQEYKPQEKQKIIENEFDGEDLSSNLAEIDQIEFSASITNMPINMDIKVTKKTLSHFIFMSPVQFKTGVKLSLLSVQGSQQLNISGEIQCIVTKSNLMGEKFAVEFEIIP